MKFIYNSKDLSYNLYVAKAGITDNANIFVKKLDMVFYREEDDKVNISCMIDENVSSIIETYRSLFEDHKPNIKFVFNAKNLSPNLFVVKARIKYVITQIFV